MLPEQKADFPKFLYLDQNIFICLARAHLGIADTAEYAPALEAVRSAIRAGKLIVPVSVVHVMETAIPRNAGRRERLAKFMVDLASNHAVLPFMPIRDAEIDQAVLREFGVTSCKPIRPWIMGKGLGYALGSTFRVQTESQEIRTLLEPLLDDPGTTAHLLAHGLGRAYVADMLSEDKKAVSELEQIRRRAVAQLDADTMLRLEVANMFTTGDASRVLQATLAAYKIPWQVFLDRIEARGQAIQFFLGLPTIEMWSILSVTRDRETGRTIDRNDTKDMAFMSVAIPYANIVVAERYWTSVVTRNRLDAKYGTRCSSDARELPRVLEEEGCL